MKRYGAILLAIFTLSVILAALPVMGGSNNNVGAHAYKINIIGRMKGTWSGDDNGLGSKVIFISLKTERLAVCEETSGVTVAPAPYDMATLPAGGQKIYFYLGGAFDVIDRDATDGDGAMVSIPAAPYGYDIYVRILGGSNKNFLGCLDADAFFYNHTADSWYYIGHLDANRKPGTPTKVDVRSLFYHDNIPYFDVHYQDYFWYVTNNGLRLMQLIFYERTGP